MFLYRVTSEGFTEKCEKLRWSTIYLNEGRKQPCECLREQHLRQRKQNCACPEIRECVCVLAEQQGRQWLRGEEWEIHGLSGHCKNVMERNIVKIHTEEAIGFRDQLDVGLVKGKEP